MKRITDQRTKQIRFARKFYFLQMLIEWLFVSFTPFMMLSATFAGYIFFSGVEFTEQAFVILLIFNILDGPIIGIPSLIAYLIICKNSLRRVSNLLSENELQGYVSRRYDEKSALKIKKAKFVWKREGEDDQVVEDESERRAAAKER